MPNRDYTVDLDWTGNLGVGTATYKGYSRRYELSGGELPPLPGTSDPLYRGETDRYNPEQLLLGALSSCHMLWYLHLCADAGVVVTSYRDEVTGQSIDNGRGGTFESATLRPVVTVTDTSMIATAVELHDAAHRMCLIADSVSFDVSHEPTVHVEPQAAA